MNDIDASLDKSVHMAPLLLPNNFHHKNMLADSLDFGADMQNIQKLSHQAKILGVKYIYTLIKEKDKIVFTSSSATEKELATNTDLSHFGDVYDDVSPIVFDVMKSKQKAYDEYTDKWGSFHTLYFPFVSDDGTQYVVGADIDISHIDEQLNHNLVLSLKNMLFYIGILIPFFLVYRAHMQQIKSELETIIEQRTMQLEIKQKQMFQQSKMASMGEMIGNIAHQWRQPLSVISTTSSGLKIQDELEILSKKELYDGLDTIVKTVQYLSQTIDNFRNFFIPNKQKETEHINEIFDTIDTIFGNSLEVANIQVIKNIENFALHTFVNELSQVIINLIKNAKDAIGTDGVIFVDCYVKDQIYIKVKDSGGGIPEHILEKIYEPYFTTKHESIGTGIGLNMSYQIITEHLHGTINVQNVQFDFNEQSMKGAEFTITLPNDIVV